MSQSHHTTPAPSHATRQRVLGRVASLCLGVLLIAAGPPNATAADYVWRNVKIGGGGYIPAIVFSPIERGVAYLRSDMGGAYRWDAKAKNWISLQDDNPVANYRGVESIAPDPSDPGVVYAAVGTYHDRPAAIMRSADWGKTWRVVPVTFRMGANELGRGLGERLAIDPDDTSILYFGSRWDGLQKSADSGQTWSKVTSFPAAGLSFVVVDPANGAKGSPSRKIFAGVVDTGNHHLFRSDDAGATWTAVAGEPRADLLPAKAEIDSRGMLYISYSNGLGPFGVSDGAVFKVDTHSGVWTDITPDKRPDAPHSGYMGISLDRQKPDTLVVASLDREREGDTIWRSTDGGAHWQDIRPLSKRDVSQTPFLLWGNKEASFGWWMTGLAIDPFDSAHVAYTTGATVYATNDLGKTSLTWSPWVEGVEQTAVITLASPAKGPHLISGIGDIGGYTHFDFKASPPIQSNPMFTNSDTVDIAGRAPNVIVRSGTHPAHVGGRTATLGYSTDYGKTWKPLYAPKPADYVEPKEIGYNYGDDYIDAAIVASADGKAFVVMTKGPVLTRDRGKHWISVEGLTKSGRPVADRVDPRRFYAVDFKKGIVLSSNDGGARFKPLPTVGLPPDIRGDEPVGRETAWPLMATPGRRGDLWFLAQHRLFHSQDGGKAFTRVNNDMRVEALAFGKAPKGKVFPAMFVIGSMGDLSAIWRSDDRGVNWIRINDDKHEYGRAFRCIAADARIFGRVYVGTDGRGIVYGEPKP